MDRDQVWEAIGQERLSLADLLDELTAQEWETPSLCTGWRVRDVAAHLTLAQMGLFPAGGKLKGFRLAATDCSWAAGDGLLVEGPMAAILLLLTGRNAALSQVSGPGAAELGSRWSLTAQPSRTSVTSRRSRTGTML